MTRGRDSQSVWDAQLKLSNEYYTCWVWISAGKGHLLPVSFTLFCAWMNCDRVPRPFLPALFVPLGVSSPCYSWFPVTSVFCGWDCKVLYLHTQCTPSTYWPLPKPQIMALILDLSASLYCFCTPANFTAWGFLNTEPPAHKLHFKI